MGQSVGNIVPTCVGRLPTHVGTMFPTYEHVCSYILKVACKVHLVCTIFISATNYLFLFNSENVVILSASGAGQH